MATTEELALARSHRLNQVQLEGATALQLVNLFERVVDPDDLADSSRVWIPLAMNVIADSHRRSNALARSYIRTTRRLRLGAGPAGALPEPGLDRAAARTSLFMRGTGLIRSAQTRGFDTSQAVRLATAEQARAGSRHALNGGRQTIDQFAASEDIVGWRRITASTACSFCRMLASRGAVYSENTVGFQAHDGCNCQPGIEYRV